MPTPPQTKQANSASTQPVARYHHREVQNLAWALTSPSIIGDAKDHQLHTLPPSEQLLKQLQQLDRDPGDLIDWLADAPSPRLGLMFERYWQYAWVRLSGQDLDGNSDLWAFNRQLHHNGRTLGEIDALNWNPLTGVLNHYELAVKFYLQLPSAGAELHRLKDPMEVDQWVGPNGIDWLHKKYQQMCERQLKCLTIHSAQDWCPWPIAGKSLQLRTHMIFKGRLFHRYHFERPACLAPYISAQHDCSHWLELEQWQHLVGRSHWIMLHKAEWLAPMWGESSDRVMSHKHMRKALTQRLEEHQTPVQVISLAEHSRYWAEAERFFIVPRGWSYGFSR